MECSKATARILQSWTRDGDTLLDIGCGAGHYLRSFLNTIPVSFEYTGIDATGYYIELAQKAWKQVTAARFLQGDAYALPVDERSFDLVMSANLFLHLPSIAIPLEQLIRAARRKVLIRMMVGDRSFRIQEVYSPETHPEWFEGRADQSEFDERGEPVSFHYFNIYSRSYIQKLLAKNPRVGDVRFIPDTFFDAQKITAGQAVYSGAPDATTILGGWQVNGYILQPWNFVEITCR
jgi:ubiquinone/menaquinone biosynthesis C-methylase UbiE